MSMLPKHLDWLAAEFLMYARQDYRDSSPLYEVLSTNIAGDPQLLEIASHGRTAIPNLFFAAVNFLLHQYPDDPLTKYYSALSKPAKNDENLFVAFRDFCTKHRNEIVPILMSRIVQTNEVSRCSYLFPAIVTAWRLVSKKPLALFDLGTSAGFHLLWDYYAYDYGSGMVFGRQTSPVIIRSELRGQRIPVGLDTLPVMEVRYGIDLNPIMPEDGQELRWLDALIWPEHESRRQLLRSAVNVLRKERSRIKLFKGDVADHLPPLLAKVSKATVPCVIQTHLGRQLSSESRSKLNTTFERFGSERDLLVVSARKQLYVDHYSPSAKKTWALANYEQHGAWIEWLHENIA